MNKIIKYLLIVNLTIPTIVSGQDHKLFNNFCIEIGPAYNTATWNINIHDQSFDYDTIFRRNKFWITPTLRIKYNFSILKINNNLKLKVSPFIGYNAFGGKSGRGLGGYHDYYLFQSIEIGIQPSLDFKNKVQISCGFKGQYIFNAKALYYGGLNQPDSVPRKWLTRDVNDWIADYSINVGIGIRYKIKKLTLGAESWFGLSNIYFSEVDMKSIRITENNYRLLIGIEF